MEGNLSMNNLNQFDKMFDGEIEEISNRIYALKETEIEFIDSEMLSDFWNTSIQS